MPFNFDPTKTELLTTLMQALVLAVGVIIVLLRKLSERINGGLGAHGPDIKDLQTRVATIEGENKILKQFAATEIVSRRRSNTGEIPKPLPTEPKTKVD